MNEEIVQFGYSTENRAPFSLEEYNRRLGKVRAAMEARGLDLLFVEDPSNMAWLTGYDGWSFYVHQGVLVFHDADPMWWGRGQDSNGAYRTVWMSSAHVFSYADNYVQSTERHPMQSLAQIIRELGYDDKRIGVEMDNYYFSARAYVTLVEELPDATLVDATALVNWQRGVKSDEELAFMRSAARISEKLVDGVLERVEPGLPKNELVAEIMRDAILGIDEHWGDYAAIVPLLPSGADAAAPHLTWDGRPFETGEATFFELSGCYRRYHAPFCRTVFLGDPPDYILNAEAALLDGMEAGLEAARAGN
ncbi:MAG: Xaa-Pro peptidase family protein, partial [Paracoccaceae bacterium]